MEKGSHNFNEAVLSRLKNEKCSFYKHFLKVFIPAFLIFTLIFGLFFIIDMRSQRKIMSTNEENLTRLVSEVITDDVDSIKSDLFYLANLPHLQEYLDRGGILPENLEKTFVLFSTHRKIYDQIRFIDLSGMEVIRVNFDGKKTTLVPELNLQSKAKRYYFEDTIKLNKGEVYVSPFDLNVENNKIEYPLKPMIRFGTPVFDSTGKKRGIIVVNYFGSHLLTILDKYSSDHFSQITLINKDGYWLKGLDPKEEWGFMFPERKNDTVFTKIPTIESSLKHKRNGQHFTNRGLVTFVSVYPLKAGDVSSTGTSSTMGSSKDTVAENQYIWKLLSIVPVEIVNDRLYGFWHTLSVVYILLILLLLLLSWQLAKNNLYRSETNALVNLMAHHDALTGLPNRRFLDDRLRKAIDHAKCTGSKFAILFLDLDGFKNVNDTLGHEAGDQLLRLVGVRLEGTIRKTDTVARQGGDEFIVLLNMINCHSDVIVVADKIIVEICKPYMIGTAEAEIGVSIGIAIYPDDETDLDSLLQRADRSLYSAKANGKKCYCRL